MDDGQTSPKTMQLNVYCWPSKTYGWARMSIPEGAFVAGSVDDGASSLVLKFTDGMPGDIEADTARIDTELDVGGVGHGGA
jgi:hypothetical protein